MTQSLHTIHNSNIVFTGFASCGKTASGRITAQRLGYRFIDLDELIEARYEHETGRKSTCREMYVSEGAEFFTHLESATLADLPVTGTTVLSTGGGAPMADSNRQLLKRFGWVVYLYAEVPVLLKRMETKGYPSYLTADPSVDHIRTIWEKRHTIYERLADLTIDTDNKTAHDVATEVILAYEQLNR